MDPEFRKRLHQFLAGRGGWNSPSTRKWGLPRFDRMGEMGLDYERFARGMLDAEDEAERFVATLRMDGMQRGGLRNYQVCLRALARFHRYRGFEIPMEKQSKPQARIYTRLELDRLHSLPYKKNPQRRLERALLLCHMGFGMRPGELVKFRTFDLDPSASTFHVEFPEKGGPKRTLKVEDEIFRRNRPLMAYLNDRPVPKNEPDALWTRLDKNEVAVPLTLAELQDTIRDAGKLVNVRANCNRGRHTRLTALTYNGRPIQYVAMFAGHTGPFSAAHRYVEVVDAGLAEHLQGSRWLIKSDKRRPADGTP